MVKIGGEKEEEKREEKKSRKVEGWRDKRMRGHDQRELLLQQQEQTPTYLMSYLFPSVEAAVLQML